MVLISRTGGVKVSTDEGDPDKADDGAGDGEPGKLSAGEVTAAAAVGVEVERLGNVIDVLLQEICVQGWYDPAADKNR